MAERFASSPPTSRLGPTITIDVRGALLVAVAVAVFLYAVDRATDWGWTSIEMLGVLAIAAALCGGVRVQRTPGAQIRWCRARSLATVSSSSSPASAAPR